MLTKQEWLLTQLASEAAEVAHAASKVIQFGLNDDYPGYGNNRDQLVLEINDLMAVVQILGETGALPKPPINMFRIADKKHKVEEMYEYAKKKGVVE